MKKAVIIGAGPAGVTAAYELLKKSDEYEVLILEESQEIGGISRTVRYNGNRMDIGGHRFFSKDDRVTAWWDEIMPLQGAPSYDDKVLGRTIPLRAGGPDPEKEDRVMLTRNRVSRIYYQKKFFDYPVKMNAQTIKNMGFATTMVAGFSYLKAAVAKKLRTLWRISISTASVRSCIPCFSRVTLRSCGDVIPARSMLPGVRSVPRACLSWAF